jgi:DNA-directed RNA polymerase subunit H (RpoH/RPB5)
MTTIYDLHTNTMNNLDKIKQLLVESNQSSYKCLEQLSIDKEKLFKINNNVDIVNNDAKLGNHIVRKINWRDNKKKIIVGSSALFVTATAVLSAIFIKK